MRALHAMERRLQDLERQFENKERLGKVSDVKFENQRWYVKFNDGGDDSPSGSDSGGGGGRGDTFKSDWHPWGSFSHGTIKMSVPPKKGQYATMRSIGGMAELATVEPHHYGPENPSPHGKQDEIVSLIEDEDEEKQRGEGGEGGSGDSTGSTGGQDGQGEDKWNTWKRETKDTHHLIIRKKEQQDQGGESGQADAGSAGDSSGSGKKKQQKSRKIPEVEEDGDDKTTQIKSTKDYILKTVGKKKSYYRQDNDKIHVRYGEQDEKADILMNEDKLQAQFKDKKSMVKWTENDLTHQMGEDDKSKMVMTEDNITVTQGGDGASKMVFSKNDVTISQGGSTSWKMSDGSLEISVGGTSWTLDASGWTQTGGSVAHNGKLIDSTHKHDQVMPGGGLTGKPILPKEGGGGGGGGTAPPGDSGSGGLA
jgi:hypothetical protein